MTTPNPIFCAIDTTDLDKAKRLIGAVAPYVGGIKLGLEFFVRHGAEGVKRVMPEGTPLFLDLKFHDIPNTVAGAVRALGDLNIFMTTLHASGGEAMMRAAKEAASRLPTNPKLLAVTVLTSLEEKDMEPLGLQLSVAQQVEKLATLAKKSGLDGIVCSPHELSSLSLRERAGVRVSTVQCSKPEQECPPLNLPPVGGESEFLLVVPGIRPVGSATGDQKRVMTPKEAMDAGASYLVIGRPITEAANPAKVAEDILKNLI